MANVRTGFVFAMFTSMLLGCTEARRLAVDQNVYCIDIPSVGRMAFTGTITTDGTTRGPISADNIKEFLVNADVPQRNFHYVLRPDNTFTIFNDMYVDNNGIYIGPNDDPNARGPEFLARGETDCPGGGNPEYACVILQILYKGMEGFQWDYSIEGAQRAEVVIQKVQTDGIPFYIAFPPNQCSNGLHRHRSRAAAPYRLQP